jgi:hypothetical protein
VKLSILRRRPSPALVISMIALFVSLSGVSYGVATGFIDSREIKNNEVRSIDIRNNQVRTRDLRNNEIRGIDIRNSTVQGRDIALNAVTGEDVKEETLGKVPSAAAADSATTAGGVSTLKIIPRTTMAEDAAPVTLAAHGPLTLSARCEASGSETHAFLFVATTEDDSTAGSSSSSSAPDTIHEVLNAADGPQEIVFLNDTTHIRSAVVTDVFASAPSGAGFTGDIATYAESTAQGRCVFHGHLALQG